MFSPSPPEKHAIRWKIGGGLGKTGACKRSIPKKVDANDNFSVNVIINNSYNDMINKLNNVMN